MRNKYIKSAVLFAFLTLVCIIIIILFGIPGIAKLTTLISDLNKSSKPIEKSDTTSPPPPILNAPFSATNSASININGSAEPGSNVSVFANNQLNEITADSKGNFAFIFKLKDGENSIYAKAKDNSGNESQQSETSIIILDTKPPDLEIIKPADQANFYGSRQRLVTIVGKTTGASGVNINGRLVILNDNSTFSFVTTLNEGENTFTVTATDAAGNQSQKNFTLHFSP